MPQTIDVLDHIRKKGSLEWFFIIVIGAKTDEGDQNKLWDMYNISWGFGVNQGGGPNGSAYSLHNCTVTNICEPTRSGVWTKSTINVLSGFS